MCIKKDARRMKAMALNEQNYVETAEKVILQLKDMKDKNKSIPMVTTSKVRNLLAMAADIYNEIMLSKDEKLSEEICSRIEYLKVRFLYEAGREPAVKNLVEKADLLSVLKNIKGSKKNYILFYHYMEAIIAYHRFYGGRDE